MFLHIQYIFLLDEASHRASHGCEFLDYSSDLPYIHIARIQRILSHGRSFCVVLEWSFVSPHMDIGHTYKVFHQYVFSNVSTNLFSQK